MRAAQRYSSRTADGPAAEGEAGDGGESVRQRGAGNAQVGGRRVADAVDGAGDPMQQERQRGARQSGEPLAYQRREKGDEAERGEDCDQGNTDHVGGQREDGGAMEDHGHGKHHDGFGDEADQHELNGPEGCNHGPCGE